MIPEGLTRKHIEDAVARGDHQMVYRGGVVDIDKIMAEIKAEDEYNAAIVGKPERVSRQPEKGKRLHEIGDRNSDAGGTIKGDE